MQLLSRIRQHFAKPEASKTVGVFSGTLGSSSGKPSDLTMALQMTSEDSVAIDPKGSPELARRVLAVASGTPYTYDERHYGGTPSPHAARLLLEDFATGLAIPHSLIEPGWQERLERIAAGKHVDPSFWQR